MDSGRTSEQDIAFLQRLKEPDTYRALQLLKLSRSQLRQDLFALAESEFKRDGYFVEFGGTNGSDLSNTYLLETSMGWRGIVAEPARCWHEALRINRKCHIETQCVWSESGLSVNFNESELAELSTIEEFSTSDYHSKSRQAGTHYEVSTISLVDLLKKYDAPRRIDYLSIDTEGSEFDILNAFDFDAYDIQVITCEHNFTPNRRKIFDLLTSRGYVRKYASLSSFDDWYVKSDISPRRGTSKPNAKKPRDDGARQRAASSADADHHVAIVEPMLNSQSGHWLRQIEATASLLPDTRVVAHVHRLFMGVSEVDSIEIDPLFPRTVYSSIAPEWKSWGKYNDLFIGEIVDGLSPRDHLYVPGVDVDVAASLLRCVRDRGLHAMPALNLRFYALAQTIITPEHPTSTVMKALAAEPGAASRLHVLTELPEQLAYVREAWGIEGEWFPYVQPTLLMDVQGAAPFEAPARYRIGVFGSGRAEKGLNRLPAIITSFRQREPDLADRVTWVVQSSGTTPDAILALKPVIEFAKENPGLIELHSDTLSSADYDALLESTDILLLPYLAGLYRLRGSGVAAEAISSGKPFVYSKGSILGSMAGESALPAGSAFGFADALARMCRELNDFRAKSAVAKAALRDVIQQSTFIRRLSAPAQG
ncbi:FkbM family methyltransferase [Phenylobacterium sp.]|uniref:FkbM family methyltransferase n=1 Tax=Phenylobacterium sp. TaxID=1871053 RepID=UPI002725BBF6|nr:FkbM family methyltransferase [Phenylobacterium sp.]MDO8800580.1 FkbM family methyltransferase [Phenylobacterium sp.]